jgi:penicillin-binding protein-related factor A (putative recombinase)
MTARTMTAEEFKARIAPADKPKRKKSAKSLAKQKTGKDFEGLLEAIFTGYANRGIANIEKVDPPVRVVGSGIHRKIIFQENPWLDYAGVWTEMGGRMLILEAKSTEEERLPIGDKGITKNQMDNLAKWHRYGASIAILWGHKGQVKVITAATITAAASMGLKSFNWRHLPATPKGDGWVIADVLGELVKRS